MTIRVSSLLLVLIGAMLAVLLLCAHHNDWQGVGFSIMGLIAFGGALRVVNL